MDTPISKAKNIPQFIALIKRYESITLEEIEAIQCKYYFFTWYIARDLTGYGSEQTCTLCKEVGRNCLECVYELYHGCIHLKWFTESYRAIDNASSAAELLAAFRARAKVLREYAKMKGIEL